MSAEILRRGRMVHLDFHTPPWVSVGEGFDLERFADTVAGAGANAICVFAKCSYGLSYYPTRIGSAHPGLRFDLLGAMVAACRRRGIEVLAYYSAGFDNRALEVHPEWEQVDAEGRPQFQGEGTWRSPCFNSPYVEELLLPQAREILQGYDVAGVLYDIVFYNGNACFCSSCIGGSRPVPRVGGTPALKAFQQESLDRFMEKVTASVKAVRPGAVVVYNGQLRIGARSAARSMDLFEIECLPHGTGYLYYPIYARYVRTLGTPFFGTTGRFHRAWGDFGTLKSAEQLRFEMATMLAHGGSCRIGDQAGPSGMLEPHVYRRIGEAFAFVREREPWCIGAEAVREAAVVSAAETEGAGFGQCHDGVRGAARMLMEEHVQFDVLDPEADFGAYRLLVVPDRGLENAQAGARLLAWVREGGTAVLSAEAVFAPDGEPLWAGWAEMSARRQTDFTVGYIRLRGVSAAQAAAQEDWFVDSPFLQVEAGAGCTVLADYVQPLAERAQGRFYSHAQAPGRAQTSGLAAIVETSIGKGRLVVIAPALFSSYHRHGMLSHREIFRSLLDRALPPPSRCFEASASPSVESSLMRLGSRLVLHLVNYHAERRGDHPEVIERMPAWDDIGVRIKTARRPLRVYEAPKGRALDFTWRDGSVTCTLPRLHVHSVIVVEMEEDPNG